MSSQQPCCPSTALVAMLTFRTFYGHLLTQHIDSCALTTHYNLMLKFSAIHLLYALCVFNSQEPTLPKLCFMNNFFISVQLHLSYYLFEMSFQTLDF